jgi:SsrA-binding protein
MRKRKLLLHKKEINKLIGKTKEKGCTLVPLKVFFRNGIAKVDIGIAKAKKLYDKRAALKKREADREIDRGMKSRNR